MAAELLEGQATVATDAFPPFLHLMVPVSPAAMVAMPSKSHVLGSAEAHFGGLVIHAHLADTLLMPACKKRTGIKFASAAPNTVAAMPRMAAITKSPSEVGGATATGSWSLRQLLQSSFPEGDSFQSMQREHEMHGIRPKLGQPPESGSKT